MMIKTLWLFLCLIVACKGCFLWPHVDDTVEAKDAIRGYYHAWWTIIPLPTDTVRNMLPDGDFDLGEVTIPEFPTGHHPIFLEVGYEMDSGPIGLKPLWMNFEEFKYDIPYIKALGSNPSADVYPLNLKSVLYMPTSLLTESSRLSYNLNASKADAIAMTDSGYNIEKGNVKFKADFKADGDWESYGPRFNIMEKITSQRWFGRWESRSKSCADHHYDYETIRFRSASGIILASEGIVSPFFPSDEVMVASLNQVQYGAVEVYANFTITSAFDCLP